MLRWHRLYPGLMSPLLDVLWYMDLNRGCLGTAWGSMWTLTHPCGSGCSSAPAPPLLEFPSDDLTAAISTPVNHLACMRRCC